MNNAGPMKNVINNAYSIARRSFNKIKEANNSIFNKKVNTVKETRVNTARPKAILSVVKINKGNAVKASACWVWRPKHKVLDHNREPLSEDILEATTQRDTGNYYPQRYWELLPKEILGAITQRDTGSYYPKRDWDVLWEN
ncbi:hypothetical protein Tco_1544698, partial [Tanacetum coccineum]